MIRPFEVLNQVANIVVIESRHHAHRTRLHFEWLGCFQFLLCQEANPEQLVNDILQSLIVVLIEVC